MKNNIFSYILFHVFFIAFLINSCIYAGKIHYAISEENIKEVVKLISQDPGCVNEKDKNGVTPLHYACNIPNFGLEIVHILLAYGAKKTINAVCASKTTPLFVAAYAFQKNPLPDRKNIVTTLIRKGANIDHEIELLLKTAGYEYPKRYGPPKQIQPEEDEPMSQDIFKKITLATELINSGAEDEEIMDNLGFSAKEVSELRKYVNQQQVLLQSSIPQPKKPEKKEEITDPKIDSCIYDGKIHTAVSEDNIKEMKELVSKNPECVNQEDEYGITPLNYACGSECYGLEMARYLLEHGAEETINIACNQNVTPLLAAAYVYKTNPSPDKLELVTLLIKKGAIIDVKTATLLEEEGYEYPKGYGPTKQIQPEKDAPISEEVFDKKTFAIELIKSGVFEDEVIMDFGLSKQEIAQLRKNIKQQEEDNPKEEYWLVLEQLLKNENATLSVLKDKGYRNLEEILYMAAQIKAEHREHIIDKIAPQLEKEYKKTNQKYNKKNMMKELLEKSERPTNKRIVMDALKEAIKLDPKTKLSKYLNYGILSEEEIKKTVKELEKEHEDFYLFNSSSW
ncbi:ankyrin repeat domain-containing protein [Candidatus Dependentiae bacterium]